MLIAVKNTKTGRTLVVAVIGQAMDSDLIRK